MRHFKKGLLALATTAALMPAGVAGATDPALLQLCSGPNACRDATLVEVTDVAVCGVSLVDATAVLLGQLNQATCTSGTHQGNTVKKK